MCSLVKSDSTILLHLFHQHSQTQLSLISTCLWCMWSGGSISTNVGLFFAAAFPPADSSGNPGRVRCFFPFQRKPSIFFRHNTRTFDRRWSVNTLQISLCLTTNQAILPSNNSTCETGSVARRWAYSSGGSVPEGRENGNFGGAKMSFSLDSLLREILLPLPMIYVAWFAVFNIDLENQ